MKEYQHKHTEHAKSLVDKDAGLVKTKEDIVYGYKSGSICYSRGITTSYETTSMSHRDDEHLVPLLNMQEKNGTKCES